MILMNNKKIVWTTVIVTIVLLLSKVSGFLRDVALAYAYGTSAESDAYILALTVVGIFSILFTAMTIAFMPIYKMLTEKEDAVQLNGFLNNTYSIAGAVTIIVAVLGVFGAGVTVQLMAPGFESYGFDISCQVTRILMLSIPFTFFMTVQCQQLRGEGHFIAPAAVAIPLNFTLVITLILLTPIYGIAGAAWAYVMGSILQFVWLFWLIRKKCDYRFKPSFQWNDPGLRRVLILTFPILIGNAIQTINTMVDRMLASGLEEGSMAALNFSNKLAIFVIGIIGLGAGNICYAKMSELGAAGKLVELSVFLKRVVNLLNLIVVPATVGMMTLAAPIVQTVFEYGAFGVGSRQMTATALFFYALGLVGYSLREMITRAFYSIQDSKTPMINGAFSVVINIVGNIILVKVMGIGGLALSTSISAIVGTLLLLFSLRRKLGHIGGREMTATFLKCSFAAAIMGVVVHFLYNILFHIINIVPIALLISIFIGMCCYGVIILMMNVPEVELVKMRIKTLRSSRRI